MHEDVRWEKGRGEGGKEGREERKSIVDSRCSCTLCDGFVKQFKGTYIAAYAVA